MDGAVAEGAAKKSPPQGKDTDSNNKNDSGGAPGASTMWSAAGTRRSGVARIHGVIFSENNSWARPYPEHMKCPNSGALPDVLPVPVYTSF